jgi:four helix bundle protein
MVEFAVKFEELLVWQKSRELNKSIYLVSKNWQDFELKDQIRRAVVSISSNITEGFERGSRDDFARFLYIAKGSGAEVRSQLYLALDLKYLSTDVLLELNDQTDHIVKLLTKFIQSLKKKRIN